MGIGIKHFNFFSSIWSVYKNNSNRMGMIIEERWSLGFGLNRVWDSHCSSDFPGSQCVTQDGLKLTVVLLPLSPMHCNYRHEPQCPPLVCGFEAVLLCMSDILKFKTSLLPYHWIDLNGLNHSPSMHPWASCPAGLSLSSLMLSVAVPASWFGEKVLLN